MAQRPTEVSVEECLRLLRELQALGVEAVRYSLRSPWERCPPDPAERWPTPGRALRYVR